MIEDVESQLRAHLKRKLKILNGKGQITVRRLVKCLYAKNGQSTKYAEEPKNENGRFLNNLAAELCEKAGGKVADKAYCRHNHLGSVASRVYQF